MSSDFGTPNVMTQPASSYVVMEQPPSTSPSVRPPDYLVLSIVSIFFCWPMAICAVMFSLSSRRSADSFEFLQAQKDSRSARKFSLGAIAVGIIVLVGTLVPLLAFYYG